MSFRIEQWVTLPMQVLHRSEAMLPVSGRAGLSALPDHLLVVTEEYAAAFETRGSVSRHRPKGLVGASLPTLAHAAGLPVRSWPAQHELRFSAFSSAMCFACVHDEEPGAL